MGFARDPARPMVPPLGGPNQAAASIAAERVFRDGQSTDTDPVFPLPRPSAAVVGRSSGARPAPAHARTQPGDPGRPRPYGAISGGLARTSFSPFPDGRHLLLGFGEEQDRGSIPRFSRRDADTWPNFEATMGRLAGCYAADP